MFTIDFLEKYPDFASCEGVSLTLLPPRYRHKPLEEVIRDDEELDTKIKSEKKRIPESPQSIVFARVQLPSHVWFELDLGKGENVQIADVVPDDYQNVVNLLMEYYLPHEPLCKAMRILDDQENYREYLHQVLFFLEASCSLVALNADRNIIGVLVGRVEDMDESSEKAYQKTVLNSKRLQTISNLLTFMTKTVNMHEKYSCKTYYRIYIIAVHKDWVRRGVEKALITGAMRLCDVMKLNRIAGAFTMYKDQYYMKQFGAKSELEIYYSEWRTERGLRIFRGTGKTEPKISFMSMAVPDNAFLPSTHGLLLTPLTSERARRFIKKRIHLWEDLDIYRACECDASTSQKVVKRKRMMRQSKPADSSLQSSSSKK